MSEEINFFGLFGLAVILNVGVTLKSTGLWERLAIKLGWKQPATTAAVVPGDENSDAASTSSSDLDKQHVALLKKYLLVYLLGTMSDWLQGPYVYALYSDYGYEQHDIAVLFVAGFGSSTFINKLLCCCWHIVVFGRQTLVSFRIF